jgi:hypothetical protein
MRLAVSLFSLSKTPCTEDKPYPWAAVIPLTTVSLTRVSFNNYLTN